MCVWVVQYSDQRQLTLTRNLSHVPVPCLLFFVVQEDRNNRVTRVISSELVRRKHDLGVTFHGTGDSTGDLLPAPQRLRGDRSMLFKSQRQTSRDDETSLSPRERLVEKQMQSQSEHASPLLRAEVSKSIVSNLGCSDKLTLFYACFSAAH
jgi:hypothetical protein